MSTMRERKDVSIQKNIINLLLSTSYVVFPGVQKFVYISVHDYNLPEFALNNGYFAAKRKTEQEVLTVFPTSGTLPHSCPFY